METYFVVHKTRRKEEEIEAAKRLGLNIEKWHNEQIWILDTKENQRLISGLEEIKGVMFRMSKYSKEDLDEAEYLVFTGGDEWRIKNTDSLYNRDDLCPKCRVGDKKQLSNMILDKEIDREAGSLKKDKSKIISPHGSFDELVIEREFYEKVFKPIGIEKRDLIIAGTDQVSRTSVQLVLPIIDEEVVWEDLPIELCPECGVKKYSAKFLGFHPKYSKKPPNEIFKSKEWYGSGGLSFHRIIVSQRLKQEIQKWSNEDDGFFQPLEK